MQLLLRNKFLLIFCLTGIVLYTIMSMPFTFWGDEFWSIRYASKGLPAFINEYIVNPDNHPPLYYLLLNIWQKLAGISFKNDWLFRLPGIIFHFSTIMFIATKFIKKRQKKIWFIILASVSSYFFMYAHMVRYYTMAAFFYVVSFYLILKWIKDNSIKSFLLLNISAIILGYIDYPSYLFFNFIIVIFFSVYKKGSLVSKLSSFTKYLLIQAIAMIPVFYLNWVYFISNGTSTIGQIQPSIFSNLLKTLMGVGFVPYQILIGEFFLVKNFPVIAVFLIITASIATFLLVKKVKTILLLSQLLIFTVLNIFVASFFLTIAIGRYPVFSYARFLLPTAYFILLILVEIFYKKPKYILIIILLVNCLTISKNIQLKDFINPIYFIPKNKIVNTAVFLKEQYPHAKIYSPEIFSVEGYELAKHFSITNNIINPGVYILFRPMRLKKTKNDLINYINKIESEKKLKLLQVIGFDNINTETKAFLQKNKLMTIPYKYYFFVFLKE